jgi:flagellar M-ring protein FliF
MMERVGPALSGKGWFSLAAGAAVAASVLAIAYLWSGNSSNAVLYAGLSGEEGGHVINELQKLNIPYRITEGGRVILVPATDVGRARLQLAAHGVPKQDNDEWALLDNEALGVSPFVEQVHYVRGIEAALSRTVGEVEGVSSAKVTVALPKQTGFLADQPKPSASVMVRLRPGVQLTGAQVRGIVGLVASSVPGLVQENVTVVDQTGRVLSASGRDGLQQVPEQLEIARQIGARYEALITDLLAPVFGRGNFRISVDADIDFAQSKQSSVKYGQSHVLSQDETLHVHPSDGGGDQPVGIPGALSNRAPAAPTVTANKPPAAEQAANGGKPAANAAAPTVPADSHTTTNYDIDRTDAFLQDPSWKLRAINVAVLVNNPTGKPIPPERIKSAKTLVTSAIGVGQNRDVTVVDLPFEQEGPIAPTTTGNGATASELPVPWWKEAWLRAVEQNAILAVAGLLALFGGLFPMLRRIGGGSRAQAGAAAAQNVATPQRAAEVGALLRAAAPAERGKPPDAAAPAAISQDVFRIDTETIRALAANDPARTALVIREWLSRDRR